MTAKTIGQNPKDRPLLLRALKRERLARPPIWLMRQAGRYLPEYREIRKKAGGFLDLCYTPEWAAEVTLQPIRRFGFDAAIIFADILLVADALGQKLDYREGEGPVLERLEDARAVARLGKGETAKKLAPVSATVSAVRKALPSDVAVIGFAGAPWTVAAYMVEGGSSSDFARAKAWALAEPELLQALIDKLVDVTVDYLAAQVTAGTDVVQLFESWAGILPAPEFQRFCVAPVTAIIRRLKARFPDLPVMVFPRGAGLNLLGYAEATGADGIGLDSQIPPQWAAGALQPCVAVQGNLDPQWLVIGGDGMRAATDALLRTLTPGPYIFNLGHGVLQQTPPEHVSELVAQVKAWPGGKD